MYVLYVHNRTKITLQKDCCHSARCWTFKVNKVRLRDSFVIRSPWFLFHFIPALKPFVSLFFYFILFIFIFIFARNVNRSGNGLEGETNARSAPRIDENEIMKYYINGLFEYSWRAFKKSRLCTIFIYYINLKKCHTATLFVSKKGKHLQSEEIYKSTIHHQHDTLSFTCVSIFFRILNKISKL